MKRLLTAAQMRAVDAAAADFGVSAAALMESAGAGLASAALRLAAERGRFLVLCGLGNNGGDGLVAARRLAEAGREVLVELMGDPSTLVGEPARCWAALVPTKAVCGRVPAAFSAAPGDVVIDALLGTGLTRAPAGVFAEAIERILVWKAAGATVVAADLPSGLQSDSGRPLGPVVAADLTVTFGYLKVGQAIEPGASLCGRVEVVDIGIPAEGEQVLSGPPTFLLEEAAVRGRLPARRSDTHKGSYGHVLVLAGGHGKTGAAALAGLGALRGGAGLVSVCTRDEVLSDVLRHGAELMGVGLGPGGPLGVADLPALVAAAEGKQALVIGPGLSRGEETGRVIGQLLARLEVPAVLDADALNALAGTLASLRGARSSLILTPHPGEMARLTGCTTDAVQADRIGSARGFATSAGVVLVLKGARTVVATPRGAVFINPTGNPGMATGGSGDVLSGLIGALLAQGLAAEDAAITGVFVHGLAGDRMIRERGQVGLIASDLLEGLGRVWAGWGR